MLNGQLQIRAPEQQPIFTDGYPIIVTFHGHPLTDQADVVETIRTVI
jgi:hypothetical protein